MSSGVEDFTFNEEDTDDELDWEEVQVNALEDPGPATEVPLEITLEAQPKTQKNNKKKGISYAERLLRIDCHKIHTVALISNAYVRNHWLNDPLLHARLLSLTPIDIQNGFSSIHKSRVPDQLLRARMFQRAVVNLVEWWAQEYFEVLPGAHIRNRTFDEIQYELERRCLHRKDEANPSGLMDEETLQDVMDDDVEPIKSPKSLMKHALNRSGCRDTSAQLFTALCRALGIPARLVVSIQSVPWKGGSRPSDIPLIVNEKDKGKGKATDNGSTIRPSFDPSSAASSAKHPKVDPIPAKSEKAKGKQKAAPKIKLRKQKDKGNVLNKPAKRKFDDPLATPPVFWTEVFSKTDAKWLPVDPIRCYVNKSKVFDPVQVPGVSHKATFGSSGLSHPHAAVGPVERVKASRLPNQLLYVLAFEEDGYARDVTRRYARQFSAKVAKAQGASGGRGNAHQNWWMSVVSCVTRPYRLNRDDLEDQELEAAQMSEGMPTTMTGFKDHAIYVLERHLKQTESIYPPDSRPVARFKGEPVYLRSSIVGLKTSENWLRSEGRMIKPGEQPMKMVKLRAGTINKMREVEALKDELKVAGEGNGEGSSTGSGVAVGEVMQGLYAFSQTTPYVPAPVIDGRVPKNNFGNIDLYVPSMLPQGAVHIPYKGVVKVARKLGFDFAEAVTGFEFKKRRAFPVIEGIVVAAEHEAVILEAYWETEREAAEKAKTQKEERVIKQWTRLIQGLRIRDRLQKKYGTGSNTPSKPAEEQPKDEAQEEAEAEDQAERLELAGGYLAGADEVVQPFNLPKDTHIKLSPPPEAGRSVRTKRSHKVPEQVEDEEPAIEVDFTTYDPDAMDIDIATPAEAEAHVPSTFIPKTLEEMAADAIANGVDGAQTQEPQEEIIGQGSILPTAAPTKAAGKLRVPPRPSNATTRRTSARETRGKKSSTPVTPAKRTRSSTKPSTSKKAQSAGRRKKRRISESEEEDDVSPSENEDAVIDLDDNDDDDDASDLDVAPVQPQPTTPSQPSGSTRTLRPRMGKTASQLAAEEMERAYRRATAR
ncbi:hypothetical protein CVT24_011921 [Panaeolus cyanescens]|uniref:Rad4 beta-hairpin domain-containing protein n=1 Tax=Panaeolus cyanescens TaxID=181874 RepID=A0A409VXT4_9AGAR|nr:hypothetical protein CVT24_011921 [Panaeolus cyanescens]